MDPSLANRIVIIDDEPAIRDFVSIVAGDLGFEVRDTGSADEFFALVESFEPTLVLLDLTMPNVDGIELLRQLGERNCSAGVVVLSGADPRVLATAQRLGTTQGLNMVGTLQKPVLLATLQEMLKQGMHATQRITAAELDNAIVERELHVYYQPKIARRGGEWVIEGAEALLRWMHPRLGLVMPGDFIPLAEESGLVGKLTDYVLEIALDSLSRWSEQGLDLTVAVNVAPQLLGDFDFPDRIARMLDAKGVDNGRLVLEITESAAMKDPKVTMHILARLRLKDIELAIDDFGIGFSSLKLLYEMPFSELKIDRSFIEDLEHNPEAGTIVNTIVQLAHNLGMAVCVEGVETPAAFDAVDALGCDKMQGFLISRAVNAASFERFVRSWSWGQRQQGASALARR